MKFDHFDKMTDSVNNAFWTKLQDVPVVAIVGEGSLVYVSPETPIEMLMRVLGENEILSVPVLNGDNHAVGFVDMIDVIEYLISAMKNTSGNAQISKFVDAVMDTTVSKIVDFSRRDNYAFFSGADDLSEIAKTLASGVVHRVATGRKFGDEAIRDVPQSICSQIDLIRFLSQEMNDEFKVLKEGTSTPLKKMADRKIIDLLPSIEKRGLLVVSEDATLLEACSQMIDDHVSAVGIVSSKDERLIGAFTPSDFKAWTKSDFPLFTQPVLEYLTSKGSTNTNPVTALSDATIGSVIHTMSNLKLHSLWLVNEKYQPIDVITPTDILRIVVSYNQLD